MANVRFAKMAPGIDGHPKIRRAGRAGREIFLFVLRRNADLDRSGRVPLTYVEPWYLADQLMMPEAEAVEGLARCVTAGLLKRHQDHVSILGWDDEWAKAPLDEAERKRRQREKEEASAEKPRRQRKQSRNVTNDNVTKSDCPDSHASEESREEEKRDRVEEKRLREASPAPTDHQRAIDHFDQRYRADNLGQKPDWKGGPAKTIADLIKSHGASEVIRRTDLLFDRKGPHWLKPPFTVGTLKSQWNALVSATAQPKSPLELQLDRVAMLEAQEAEQKALP